MVRGRAALVSVHMDACVRRAAPDRLARQRGSGMAGFGSWRDDAQMISLAWIARALESSGAWIDRMGGGYHAPGEMEMRPDG